MAFMCFEFYHVNLKIVRSNLVVITYSTSKLGVFLKEIFKMIKSRFCESFKIKLGKKVDISESLKTFIKKFKSLYCLIILLLSLFDYFL